MAQILDSLERIPMRRKGMGTCNQSHKLAGKSQGIPQTPPRYRKRTPDLHQSLHISTLQPHYYWQLDDNPDFISNPTELCNILKDMEISCQKMTQDPFRKEDPSGHQD